MWTWRTPCGGRRISRRCIEAEEAGTLLGLEGEAAAVYFARMPSMLAASVRKGFVEGWSGRVGRGAADPLNVSLNVVYGLLLAEVIRGIHACGMDPHAGFLHSSSRNKPALALDLMEEFRPALGDAVVVGAINSGELSPQMFTSALGGVRLRDSGRQALVRAYERRVDQRITHPVFGYAATWRRTIEIQARMVLGVLDGSQERYVGVRLR